MSISKVMKVKAFTGFWVKALLGAIRELTPKVKHTRSYSRAASRWSAAALLKNPSRPTRMPRQDFLSLFGQTRKTSAKDARGSKKKSSFGAWKSWKPQAKTVIPEGKLEIVEIEILDDTTLEVIETVSLDQLLTYNPAMGEIKSYQVAKPFEAQTAAWQRRVFMEQSAPVVVYEDPRGSVCYGVAPEGWVVPSYPVETEVTTTQVVPTHKIVRFTPATFAVAGVIAAAAAAAKDISDVISAHYAERRATNRTNFTLAAVIGLTAPRKGTATKAGGVGIFACSSAALTAAVVDTVVGVVTAAGAKTNIRVSKTRKTVNTNQAIARRERVKRQRRNGRRRVTRLTLSQKRVKQNALFDRLQAKVERRRAAKALAARTASSKVGRYSVVTKAAQSANLRARNNAIWLATGVEAPICKSAVAFYRQVEKEEEAALPAAIRYRRMMAEGTYDRSKDGQAALGYNNDSDTFVATPRPVKSEEDLAEEAFMAGKAIEEEILNGLESASVAVPSVDITARTAARYPAAEGMTMSWNRSRTPRPKPTDKYKKRAPKAAAAKPKAEEKSGVSPAIQKIADLWTKIDAKNVDLQEKLDSLVKRYRAITGSEATYSTIISYLYKAHDKGAVDCSAYIDSDLQEKIEELKSAGVKYNELSKKLGVNDLEIHFNYYELDKKSKAKTENRTSQEKDTPTVKSESKDSDLSPRHTIIRDIWNRVYNKNEDLEDMLSDLATGYRAATKSTCKRVSVESYLLDLYIGGHFERADILSEEALSAVKVALSKETFVSPKGLTYLEVGLAKHTLQEDSVSNKEQNNKRTDKYARRKRNVVIPTKEMEVKAKQPLRFTKSLEEMDCIPAFTMSHVDAPEIGENDAQYVILTRYGQEACNANAHFSPVPKYKPHYEDLYYAADNSEFNIPVSNFLGFDYKDETKKGWTGSTVGASPARILAPIANKVKASAEFRDAAFCNVEGVIFNSVISNHINFYSLVDGEHDLKDKVKGRLEVGDTAKKVRDTLRKAVNTGAARLVNQLAAHGQTVVVHNALNDLEAEYPGIIDPRTGEEIDQHYLLIVGRVAKLIDDRREDENGSKTKGQYRAFCDRIDAYFVPTDVVESLVDLETPRTDNNFFTFIEREEKEEVASGNPSRRLTREERLAKRKKVAEAAAAGSNQTPPKAKEEDVKEEEETKTEGPASKETVSKEVVVEKKVVKKETAKKQVVTKKSYADELAALYHASNHPTSGNRAEAFYTAEEVVAIFAGIDTKAKAAAYAEMFGENAPEGMSTAQNAAFAVAYYLRGYCSERNANPCSTKEMPLLDHDWCLDDIKGVISIIQECIEAGSGKTAMSKRRRGRKGTIKDVLFFDEVDGMTTLKIDGRSAFYFGNDGVVYDSRGRAFSSCLFVNARKLTDNEKKANPQMKGFDVDIKLVTSMSMFMYFIWLVYLPILASWSGSAGIYTNSLANIESAMLKLSNIFKMTTDRVLDQNGAAQHMLVNTFAPIMYEERTPLNIFKGEARWAAVGSKPAKLLADRYNGTEAVDSEVELMMEVPESKNDKGVDLGQVMDIVMELGHREYGIDFNYAKSQFVAGVLGHVNLDMVKEYAPTLFEDITAYLGCDIEAYHVITNSLKSKKGLKRVALWMAQAESVKNEKPSAAMLYGQQSAAYGWLNKAGYAPSHVCLPGMSAFLGKQEDKPEANPVKRISYPRNNFKEVDGSPFDFTKTTVAGVVENNWVTEEVSDGWFYTTPEDDVYVTGSGKEILFGIHGGEPVRHEKKIAGRLTHFRWRFAYAMDNKSEVLEIEYFIETAEFDMKSRQINKSQFFKATPKILFNELNADLNPEEVTVVGLHLQDGLKLDTVYAMAFVIANTAYHNDGDNEVLRTLRGMITDINIQLVGHENIIDGKPVLVVEPASVHAGVYAELYAYFDKTFGQSRWIHWIEAGTMGRTMYDLYVNKVAGKVWFEVDNYLDVVPEVAYLGDDLWVIAESKEITNETNILVFKVVDGVVTDVAQRGVMYLSIPGVQVYNVELFESSTVAQAVTTSVQLLPCIQALSIIAGEDEAVLAEQRRMVEAGKDAMYRAKALHSFTNGNPLHEMLKQATIVVDDQGVCFADDEETDECRDLIETRLAAAGIDFTAFDRYEDGLFRKVAEASQDIVFFFQAGDREVSMWLPAMLSFTSLSSKSDNNLDFVGAFFYEVLLPCIEGTGDKDQVILNQVGGILDSLASSKNTRKYFSGDKIVGGKRIGFPNIPVGEVWILESNLTGSIFQEAVRGGFPMDRQSVAEGIITSGSRAPMPMGPVERIRLVEDVYELVEVEYEDGTVETVEVHAGQRLVPFEGEVPRTDFLPYELSPVQIGVSAMSINLDGGDDDGDGYFLALCKHLTLKHLTTYELVVKLRSAAVGMDMFSVKCGDYAADHYTIKSHAAAMTTLKDVVGNKALKPAKDYIEYNFMAYSIQNIGVGVMYAAYSLAMYAVSIINELDRRDILKNFTVENGEPALINFIPTGLDLYRHTDADSLILVLAEVYEIMLGGFSDGAKLLWQLYLQKIMNPYGSMYKPEFYDQAIAELENYQDAVIIQRLQNIVCHCDEEQYTSELLSLYADARRTRLDMSRVDVIDTILLNLFDLHVDKDAEANIDKMIKSLEHIKIDRALEDDVAATLKELGANYKKAEEFTIALKLLNDFYIIKRGKADESPEYGISYVLYVIFQGGRGKLLLGSDSSIYQTALAWLDTLKEHPEGAEAVRNNVPLMALDQLDSIFGSELGSADSKTVVEWTDKDLAFFLKGMKTVEEATLEVESIIHNANVFTEEDDTEEDSESDDGGSVPSGDDDDSDDDGDGGTEAEVETTEAPAPEQEAPASPFDYASMSYKEIKDALKEYKDAGCTGIELNGKKEDLLATLIKLDGDDMDFLDTEVEAPTAEPEAEVEAPVEEEAETEEEQQPEESAPADKLQVVISGSRSITSLPDAALDAIDDFIAMGASFNVGDAAGVDTEVQKYLAECGVNDVTVWYCTSKPRNQVCSAFDTYKVSGNFTQRDAEMHRDCDKSLVIWDGSSTGSMKNIKRVQDTIVIKPEEELTLTCEEEIEQETTTVESTPAPSAPPAEAVACSELALRILVALEETENLPTEINDTVRNVAALLHATGQRLAGQLEETEKSASTQDDNSDDDVPGDGGSTAPSPSTPPSSPDDEEEAMMFAPVDDLDDTIPVARATRLTVEIPEEDAAGILCPPDDFDETIPVSFATQLFVAEPEEDQGLMFAPEYEPEDIPLCRSASLTNTVVKTVAPASAKVVKTKPAAVVTPSVVAPKAGTTLPNLKPVQNSKGKLIVPSFAKIRKHKEE